MSAQLLTLIVRYVPSPEGVSAEELYNCTVCYEDEIEAPDFDPAVATAALEAEILEPMAAQQDRLDAADVVTRLFTTMDASEMTADPQFVFNADVPQAISNVRTATDTSELNGCGDRVSRRLRLEDGRTYQVADPANPSLSPHEDPAALVIEDLGASGAGTVLFDGRDAADAEAASTICGCAEDTGGQVVVSPAILLLMGLLRRRRR